MWQWLLPPLAYLMGSLSSAVIISRVMNLPDPREEGSKNPGATNVLRLGGKKAAGLTLFGDMAKGLVPVIVAILLKSPEEITALVALFAFMGHLYPVFFGFKGGKGVATALGVLAGLHWLVGPLLIGTWLSTAWVTRISSLSALLTALLAPLYVGYLTHGLILTITTTIMSVLLFWRHRNNIQRLLRGEEARIGR